jgi:hypothetical protein
VFSHLFSLLTSYATRGDTFNQYCAVDPSLDQPDGASIRCQNLRCYLEAFRDASFLLVGEAAGYAGCRFSGIPFTCEAQLGGSRRLTWTQGWAVAPSSLSPTPWLERSATMVWESIGKSRDIVLWNAYPWHPFGRDGLLSNRRPGAELRDGYEVLQNILSLFPTAQPYAIGRVAQKALADIGLEAPYIRHPSHGGKRQFLEGMTAILGEPSARQGYGG